MAYGYNYTNGNANSNYNSNSNFNYNYAYPNYGNNNYQNLFQPMSQLPPIGQQNFINGKIVDSLEVVKAMDIPMDGNSYYFPKADGTEIYSKRWLANGQTQVTSYKPILDDLNEDTNILSSETLKGQIGAFMTSTDAFMKKIDERLDKIEKSFTNVKKNFGNAKSKESETE